MIVVTGAAGFIASVLVSKLNKEGFSDLILVDDFSPAEKQNNYSTKQYTALVNRNDFPQWLDENYRFVEFIFHLGARTDTTETDTAIFDRLNLNYTKSIWQRCVDYQIPLVYASSAATYGNGDYGYDDDESLPFKLQPLNPYGRSKNDFDKWALTQEKKPFFWAGLKFFNVYGPNEYHKGRMASVIFHAFNQIKETGKVKLFKSHRPDYKDGWQLRDFIYVKDVVDIMYFLMHHRTHSGLYNVGTGQARSFFDLATATFNAMNLTPNISFIDMPEDIRDTYQYFTEAKMEKLKAIGYDKPFHSLEEGVSDYVQYYLSKNLYE